MTTTTKHRKGGSKGANGYGEYQVRYASDKQKVFINSLLNTKENSFGEIDFDTLNVQGATELIEVLLKLPNKQGVIAPASEKQISFANALIQKKEGGYECLLDYLNKRKVNAIEQLDRADVSAIIAELKLQVDKQAQVTITEVGAYLLGETIYSIREGNHSKRLQVWGYNEGFEKYLRVDSRTEKDVLSQLQPENRLTLEQAIKYSAHTGICVHCGRTLTLLKSVAGGMGAICAKKYH